MQGWYVQLKAVVGFTARFCQDEGAGRKYGRVNGRVKDLEGQKKKWAGQTIVNWAYSYKASGRQVSIPPWNITSLFKQLC